MELDLAEVEKIKGLIEGAERICMISHKSPDGDTLGSALGLYHVFLNMNKKPAVICLDPPPEVLRFMPGAEQVKTGPPPMDFDLYFVLDAGATHLTGFNESHPALFDKSMPVVNIDHHPTNEKYGRYNVVIPTAASTTIIVHEMLQKMGYPVDRQTATCLLTGLYTDTGSFMHSNTTAETLRIGAKLLSKGANLRMISKEIFRTLKISTMHLWGRVLKNIEQTPEGVTVSVVTEKDFEECSASYDEMTGVVDYVNSIPGAVYSVILTEKSGAVKGSLRTLKDSVDVSEIASRYGGGGHTKAAGFTVKGRLEKEIRWKVVQPQ